MRNLIILLLFSLCYECIVFDVDNVAVGRRNNFGFAVEMDVDSAKESNVVLTLK